MLNEKLKQAKIDWETKRDWERNALKEVYQYNLQFRKEIKTYPYNDSIKDYILEREKIDGDLIKTLSIEIYLSQKQIDKEEKENYKNKMLAEGWLELNEEIVKKAIEEKKKIQLKATANNDWATIKIDKVLKPHCFNGKYGLMELRAKTRGYNLSQFENAFCKLV